MSRLAPASVTISGSFRFWRGTASLPVTFTTTSTFEALPGSNFSASVTGSSALTDPVSDHKKTVKMMIRREAADAHMAGGPRGWGRFVNVQCHGFVSEGPKLRAIVAPVTL